MHTLRRWIALVVALVPLASARAQGAEPAREAVLVAARDLSAGEKVSTEDLAQRAVPVAFVSRSHVKLADARYVVAQKVVVPILKGELLRWSFFETLPTVYLEPCKKGLGDPGTPAQQVARARRAALGPSRK